MRSMDMSRSPDSLISCPCSLYHVRPARVLVRFLPVFTCFLYLYKYGLMTRLRLPSFSVLSPFVSSTRQFTFSRLCLSPFVLLTRLQTRYFWNPDSLVYLRLVCLSPDVCTCILVCCSPSIYTDWGWRLFSIFNLLCNHPKGATCEIPRTLLILSSSLAKATALRFLRSHSPLSTHLPVVKSSLHSVLRCARNRFPPEHSSMGSLEPAVFLSHSLSS